MRGYSFVLSVLVLASSLAAQNGGGVAPLIEFATTVVDFQPGPGITAGVGFGVTSRILGAPMGPSDVLSLGAGGQVTVGFSSAIRNGPGTDFIVVENGFAFSAGVFAELAFVEVSTDGVVFARFPSRYLGASAPVGAFGAISPGTTTGLAGAGVPFYPGLLLDYRDACLAGGDAMDLDDLLTHPLVSGGQVDLQNINFVRLVDIEGDGFSVDSLGTPIYDAWGGPGSTSSADFDGIAVINSSAIMGFNAAPEVALGFNPQTRILSIMVSDIDGLGDLTGALCASLNQVPFDFNLILPFFSVVSAGSDFVVVESLPLPPGSLFTMAFSVADSAGTRGGDVLLVAP